MGRFGDAGNEDGGCGEEREAGAEGGHGRERIEQAARDRAADGSDLVGERIDRYRALQPLRRDEVGDDGLPRGAVEGARGAEDRQQGEDRGDPGEAALRQDHQPGGDQRHDAKAYPHDRPAGEAVGDGAGDEDQQQRWQELRQAHEAEVEWVAGGVVDLPADCDGLDLDREAGGDQCRPVESEAGIAKRLAPVAEAGAGHRTGR